MKNLFSILFGLFAPLLFSQQLLIEAEAFQNKGGWVVDQQFIDQMGSSY